MWLRIIEGPDRGTAVELTGERFVIGRGADCDWVLDDLEASRSHAAFTPAQKEGCWVLADLGTTNGTHVNGIRIDRPVLIEGDETIKLGDTVLFASLHDPKATAVRLPGEDHTEQVVAAAPQAPLPAPITPVKKALLVAGPLVALLLVVGIGWSLWNANDDEDCCAIPTETIVSDRTAVVSDTVAADPFYRDREDILAGLSEEEFEAARAELEKAMLWQMEDVDRFWAQTIPDYYGIEYVSPRLNGAEGTGLYTAGDGLDGACGPLEDDVNAYYCPADHTVQFGEGLMLRASIALGEVGVSSTVAHEWGHALQSQLGFEYANDIKQELQADCFQGVWTKDAADRNALRRRQLDRLIPDLLAAGDGWNTTYFDPGAHGTGLERTQAFLEGYRGGEAGLRACDAYATGRGEPYFTPEQ